MITEQELKDRCTPDIIKKMVELAEGFEYVEETEHDVDYFIFRDKKYFTSKPELFPLLIHRAVEGWNKEGTLTITIDHCSAMIYGRTALSYRNRMLFNDYQPESLTPYECACLHCLIEVLG